eukprot:scaffold23468_cov44-Attheya_sp.AAC.1
MDDSLLDTQGFVIILSKKQADEYARLAVRMHRRRVSQVRRGGEPTAEPTLVTTGCADCRLLHTVASSYSVAYSMQ